MRVKTVLKILSGLIVLVLAVVIVAALVVDPNEYKDEIVAAVEDNSGRKFSIESDIDLRIGLTPSFAVSGVRMSNADWGSRPDMMSVGEFAAEVALLPLIFGNLQINQLILRDAEILIETDAKGSSNLDFGGGENKQNASDTVPSLPQVSDVLVENAVLTFVDGVQNTTTKLDIKRLSAKANSLSAPLAIDILAAATLDGQPIEFSANGELGAPNLLLATSEPYPVDLAITGLGLTAQISGAIADLKEISGMDFSLEIAGDDLQGLTPLSGDGLPPVGPVALTTTLKGSADNPALENIALNLGQTDIAGNLSVDLQGKRPRLEGAFSATQVDISELISSGETPAPASAQPVAEEQSADKPKPEATERLFSADPLPLDILRAFDAQIDFSFAKLVLPSATLADTKGKFVLDNGALALKPVTAALVGSAVTGNIGVDTRNGPASVSIDLKAPKLDLGELLREVAGLDKLRGAGAVDISLRGAGSSVAEIMSSLNGHSRLLMDEGEMKNDFLGNVSGLTETLGEAFGKKEWILVECIASDFDISNGIASSRINVINTELLLITTDGKVDLGQEKPDLKVTPRPKGIDLSLAVPVNIGGSLASPTFTPDALATAKKIGGILGAIAFPPAAIIGLGELGSSDNPCLQTAAAEGAPQPQPSEPATPVEAVTDTAKEAIEDIGDGIGKGLKKIFGN